MFSLNNNCKKQMIRADFAYSLFSLGAIMTLPITIADKNIMCRAEELIKQSFYQSKTEIKTQRSPQNQSVLESKESMSEQLSNLKLNCEEDDNGDFKHKSNEDQLQGSDEEDTYIDKDDQDEYSDASDYDDQYEDDQFDDDDGNELVSNDFHIVVFTFIYILLVSKSIRRI